MTARRRSPMLKRFGSLTRSNAPEGSALSEAGGGRTVGGEPRRTSPQSTGGGAGHLGSCRVEDRLRLQLVRRGLALPSIGTAYSVGPAQWGLLAAAFLVGAACCRFRPVPRPPVRGAHGLPRRSRPARGERRRLRRGPVPPRSIRPSSRRGRRRRPILFASDRSGRESLPRRSPGIPVGGFSSAFSAGAALGVVGSALLIPLIGWQLSLVLGGAVLGVITLLGIVLIPATAGAAPPKPSVRRTHLPAALRYRGVWAIGIAFIGLEGATFATGQFLVPGARRSKDGRSPSQGWSE